MYAPRGAQLTGTNRACGLVSLFSGRRRPRIEVEIETLPVRRPPRPAARALAVHPSYPVVRWLRPSPLFQRFAVAISVGSHPFPSRTRKLSLPEPMVLHGKPCGRVGRCRIFFHARRRSRRRAFSLCAQHGRDLEVEVLWGTRSQGPRANRKATVVRPALKEAGSEAASRRTGTGYEAVPTRASGQRTAKLSRPKGGDVDPAAVR